MYVSTLMAWTVADLPDLSDRTYVVTGANAGIGFETARALAGAGATVVLACRNLDKAAAARGQIEAGAPRGRVERPGLQLADRGQIAVEADAATEHFPRPPRRIHNARLMGPPRWGP